MPAIVVQQTRGTMVENAYRGDVAVVDSTGRVLFAVGDYDKATFWRSSAKPIQAMPVVLTGAAEAFGFGPKHLAIFSASHNGEPVHTETVLDAMRLAGLTTDLLQCGAHPPFDREAAEALTLSGKEAEYIHNNCSGKHTGMLAMAKHLGLPSESYMDPKSDLQQLILAHVASVVGLRTEEIAIGVDGCGVPVFGMPICNMAWAWARLADPTGMPQGLEEAGRRVREAMLKFPYLIAGKKRICTELMTLMGSRFVAKSGAEGVYCVGVLPSAVSASPMLREAGAVGGVGITVKIEDGNHNVRHQVTVGVMQQLGLLSDEDMVVLKRYTTVPIKNWAGTVVGESKPVFRIEQIPEAKSL